MKLKNKKALVTGGAGFIGSHLVDELLRRGNDVVVLDNFSTGKLRNLKHVEDKIEIIRGDICNFEVMKKAADGCEVIFHEAASSLLDSLENPQKNAEVNVIGTLNVLEAARKSKSADVVVFASTGSVYGELRYSPQDEKHPLEPISPYGVAKLAAEKYVLLWNKTYGINTTALRYFNIYGPRKYYGPKGGVVEIFVKNALTNTPITIEWDGLQEKSFTYVSDTVDATVAAAEIKKAYGNAFNISYTKATSIKELAKLTMELCGRNNLKINYAPKREGDIRRLTPSIKKAQKLLNFKPKVELKEGLLKVIEWMKEELK